MHHLFIFGEKNQEELQSKKTTVTMELRCFFVIFVILTLRTEASTLLDKLPIIGKELYSHSDLNFTRLSPEPYKIPPEAYLTTIELIGHYGYNPELHYIQTSDGYILEMHRITGRKTSPSADGKPPVLIVHGLLTSSADWVLAGPEKGLGFLLSDAGYDVWLGNVRGNVYCRTHAKFKSSSKAFWNFSWNEMGHYDLPIMIDFILAKNGREKLIYIGHSQGTTSFFVMACERPEYNDKVAAMFALAPVASCRYLVSPVFKFLARFAFTIAGVMNLLGERDLQPNNKFFNQFKMKVCDEDSGLQSFCRNVIFLINGFNPKQMNNTMLPVIIGHAPAGASIKQILHYAQLVRSGHFRKYDYGAFDNMKYYKRSRPPAYNLKHITTPISLHYSDGDWLAHPKDVLSLYNNLQNPIGMFKVPDEKFNHIDFMYATDVKTLLYDKVISLMDPFRSQL